LYFLEGFWQFGNLMDPESSSLSTDHILGIDSVLDILHPYGISSTSVPNSCIWLEEERVIPSYPRLRED
jgi:hypothetical protein